MFKRNWLVYSLLIVFSLVFGANALAQDTPVLKFIPNTKGVPSNLKSLVDKGLIFSFDKSSKTASYLTVGSGVIPLTKSKLNSVSLLSQQFLKDYAKYFGLTNYKQDLRLLKTQEDSQGYSHFRYAQYFKGVPVYGGEMIVHVNGSTGVEAANGKITSIKSLDVKPVLSKSKGEAAAIKAGVKKGLIGPKASASRLVIFNKRGSNSKAEDKNYLTWQVTLSDRSGWREDMFINAKTGAVVYTLPLVFTANTYTLINNNWTVVARALLESATLNRQAFDCRPEGCMQNTTVGHNVITYSNNFRAEGQPAMGVPEVDNLYTYLGDAYNYYFDTFGLHGANSLGGIGVPGESPPATSTFGLAYFMATGTYGHCPNAWGGKYDLAFCEGYVNLTVVGHEYTHAVTAFQGPLTYEFQSGAINEAMSDFFSAAIERYATGVSSWKTSHSGVVSRNFADPLDPVVGTNYPMTLNDPNYVCKNANQDHGGVHTNAMVVTHMAYLLSVGGELNGCNITPIGQEKVENIFFHTLVNNNTPNAGFNELYDNLSESCRELYGMNSAECKSLFTAMVSAELDQSDRCSGLAPHAIVCNALEIPVGGERWRFGSKVKLPIEKLSDVLAPTMNVSSTQPSSTSNTVVVFPTVPTPDITSKTKTPVVEEEVRTPSFTVDVIQNDKDVTINGVLNYYGKGTRCSGPRYFDPIIVAWGQVNSHPVLKSDNTFTASHTYNVKNKEYNLSVSVTNSCFGSYVFHKTILFPVW